jgi:hypothetical protein
LFSYEHALAYLVNDCNLTEELAEQVLDQFNDKTGKYSWEEIAEGIRTGRIKFSGNMDIDCDESYKRASPTRSNVPVTDRFAGSVPDPFGSFYPDKQDTPVPSAFDEARASGSYNNIPQIVVDNPERVPLWLFTEAGDGLWRSTTAAVLASASGQERNRQKEADQVAPKSPLLLDEAWNVKAPKQVQPGIRTLRQQRYNPRTKQVETSTVHYDEFGRQVKRTDYTNHGFSDQAKPAEYHTDPHVHVTEYGPGYESGRSTRINIGE